MANVAILSKTLRCGVDESLYVAAAGAFNTTGTAGTGPLYGCFGMPPQSMNWRGNVAFQAVGIGGSVTAATFQVECSLDGGNTWGIVSRAANYGSAAVALSALSGIAFGTFNITGTDAAVVIVDLSGLGGSGTLRLNFTTVTLGAGATGFNVYAHLG
jgi:hypothetical protein